MLGVIRCRLVLYRECQKNYHCLCVASRAALARLRFTPYFEMKACNMLHQLYLYIRFVCGGGGWQKGGIDVTMGEERHGCWGDRRPCAEIDEER